MTDGANKLIVALREDAEWVHANEWETPITLGDNLDEAADLIESLSDQLEQVTRERDAAVEDLRKDRHCDFCINDETKDKLPFACTFCGSEKRNWRWRGVGVEG